MKARVNDIPVGTMQEHEPTGYAEFMEETAQHIGELIELEEYTRWDLPGVWYAAYDLPEGPTLFHPDWITLVEENKC